MQIKVYHDFQGNFTRRIKQVFQVGQGGNTVLMKRIKGLISSLCGTRVQRRDAGTLEGSGAMT